MDSFQQWMDIGVILADGKDLVGSRLMTVAVAVVSPLVVTDMNAELLVESCARDFPIVPTICPMAGSTSPYTRAGTLLQGHAENLMVAALTQLINPGNPYLYTFGPSVTDMHSSHDLYYTLDKVLWKSAAVQLAAYLGIPASAECGGSLTYRYDPQLGAEGVLFMLSAASSGAQLLCGIGSCHNANGMSAEMMIIQNEWLNTADHLRRGIPLGEKHLALGNIADVGPGGHFFTDPLTLELLHSDEFFSGEILDTSGGYTESLSMLERAHDQVESMTAQCASPLPGHVQEELRRYFHDEYAKMLG
jgi:trimethylamine--corrinoid protein Co-methyltransferase